MQSRASSLPCHPHNKRLFVAPPDRSGLPSRTPILVDKPQWHDVSLLPAALPGTLLSCIALSLVPARLMPTSHTRHICTVPSKCIDIHAGTRKSLTPHIAIHNIRDTNGFFTGVFPQMSQKVLLPRPASSARVVAARSICNSPPARLLVSSRSVLRQIRCSSAARYR
jgi:hypothetical protein